MKQLTHLNDRGEARMVDVTDKPVTSRTASASARVRMHADTLALLVAGQHPKGDVLATARIAGIMAAKKTAELIPLCHPLLLSKVMVDLQPDAELPGIRVMATCRLAGQTGVEMEALTAASVAALTVYDMCKAVDKRLVIEDIKVLEKTGGKSGDWTFDSLPETPTLQPQALSSLAKPAVSLKVVFFAELREQLGAEQMEVSLDQLPPQPTLGQLLERLKQHHAHWQAPLAAASLLMAVNQQMAKPGQVLQAGDEVAFFPPVTGG